MDGVSRASGAGYIVVEIPRGWPGPLPEGGGFDAYKWPPMRVEEYAVVENHLLKNRVSPVDAIMPDLVKLEALNTKSSRRLAKQLSDKAYRDLRKSKAQNRMSIEEVQEWIDTPEGVLFTMKICLQRYHPDITDAEVRRVFDWLGEEEAKRQRDIAQGTDRLGNSTGPTAEAPAAPGPVAASPGAGSTGGSPASTGGPPAPSTT